LTVPCVRAGKGGKGKNDDAGSGASHAELLSR